MQVFHYDGALPPWFEVDKENPSVLRRLGACFESGTEVERDINLAQACYLEAASKGDRFSARRLAELVWTGVVPLEEVRRWIDAGLEGQADPMALAAWVLDQLQLIERNHSAEAPLSGLSERLQALVSTVKERGDAEALYLVGRGLSGRSVELDSVLALDCYIAACEGGSSEAVAALALGLFDGRWGEQAELCADLLHKAAHHNAEAAYRYAQCLDEGLGVPQDKLEAVHWLQKAAEGGYAPACFALGWDYDRGEGVEANAYEAVRWYGCGADGGHPPCMYALAIAHLQGEGCSKSLELAQSWLERAAEAGHGQACVRLAELALAGETVTGRQSDERRAFSWFYRGAQLGDKEAMRLLSDCYEQGRGTQADSLLARVWKLKSRGDID